MISNRSNRQCLLELGAGLVFLFGFVGINANGQDESAENQSVSEPAKSPTNEHVLKDPTQLSPRMREMLAPKPESRAVEVAKVPPPQLPEIKLRGVVLGKDAQGTAALEVKGDGIFMVGAGSTFAAKSGTRTLTIVVRSITAVAIELEIPELQQTLTLR